MDAALKKRSISKYSKVFSIEFTGGSSSEAVVPDVLPDIADIVFSSGAVLLRSKTTEDGKVSLSASIAASVVYSPENDTGLNCLHLALPFEAEAEDPDIIAECRTVAELKLASIDARMINTRKVSVHAEVLISIACYSPDAMELAEDVEAPPEAGLHVKKQNTVFSVISDVREKTFVITDEYAPPAGTGAVREILFPVSSVRVDDVKALGNKLVLRGVCQTRMLCVCGDDRIPQQLSFSTNFSQMLEMDSIGSEPDVSAGIMLTAAYYEPSVSAEPQDTISMELHLVAQVVCSRTESAELIYDMYSNRCDCSFEHRSDEFSAVVRRQPLRAVMRAAVRTPVPASEIVFTDARVTSLSGGSVGASIAGIYIDEEGLYRGIKSSAAAEVEAEFDKDMSLHADSAFISEIFASTTADGIEFRIPAEADTVITRAQTVITPEALRLAEKAEEELPPSVVLVPAADDADMWQLAKRYRSTPELIERANAVCGGEPAMLLIPREP